MLNFKVLDDDCSKKRRVAQARLKSKGQIQNITKYDKCFILNYTDQMERAAVSESSDTG